MSTSPTIIDQLLYEERERGSRLQGVPYAFAGADDDQKAELLKDILGLANAWRRTAWRNRIVWLVLRTIIRGDTPAA